MLKMNALKQTNKQTEKKARKEEDREIDRRCRGEYRMALLTIISEWMAQPWWKDCKYSIEAFASNSSPIRIDSQTLWICTLWMCSQSFEMFAYRDSTAHTHIGSLHRRSIAFILSVPSLSHPLCVCECVSNVLPIKVVSFWYLVAPNNLFLSSGIFHLPFRGCRFQFAICLNWKSIRNMQSVDGALICVSKTIYRSWIKYVARRYEKLVTANSTKKTKRTNKQNFAEINSLKRKIRKSRQTHTHTHLYILLMTLALAQLLATFYFISFEYVIWYTLKLSRSDVKVNKF